MAGLGCHVHCFCMHCMRRGAASGRAPRQLAIAPLHLCFNPLTSHPPALWRRPWVGRGCLGHPCHHDAGGRWLLWAVPGRQSGTAGLHNDWPSQQYCWLCAPAWRVSNSIVARVSPMFEPMPHHSPVSLFSVGHLALRHGPRGHGLCGRGGRRSHAGAVVAGVRRWQGEMAGSSAVQHANSRKGSCGELMRGWTAYWCSRYSACHLLHLCSLPGVTSLPGPVAVQVFARSSKFSLFDPAKEMVSGGGDASQAAAALLHCCCCLRVVGRHCCCAGRWADST